MTPINANAGEYRSVVGLDSLYIALVSADAAAAYTAGTPEWLAPAAEASFEPSQNTETQYADDQAYDVMYSRGEVKITLDVTKIPPEMLALITGNVFNAASGRVFENGGTPAYFAVGGRALKSNGSYVYFWWLKGKFDMPKESATTKGDTPDPKLVQVVFTAIKTIYKWDLGSVTDGVYRVFGDTDTTNFSATGWFAAVQAPSVVAPSALALSSSDPTDAATGVAITKTCVLTFNNALINNAIYNVTLIKASDGAVVASAITLDTTKKIITIDPTGSLTGTTEYIIVYAVIDIYGQTLAGAVNFQTV